MALYIQLKCSPERSPSLRGNSQSGISLAAKLLTDSRIRAAKVGDRERLLADGDGLFLRLRPTGRDWLFVYSFSGRRRKMGFGPYPDMSLERARQQLADARALVANGQDPIEFRDNAKAAKLAHEAELASRLTVSSLFEQWHEKVLVGGRRDNGKEIQRVMKTDVLNKIGALYAADVQRTHIREVLSIVLARGSKASANKTLQYLRQMFRFAVSEDILPVDPTAGLTKERHAGGREAERSRILSESEIRELAVKLPDSGLQRSSQLAAWILLGTICRIGELTMARWEHVDFAARTWTIPAATAKNGREHVINLSFFAIEQLQALKRLSLSEIWLYPNASGNGHLHTKALQKQFRDRQRSSALAHRTKQVGCLVLSGGDWRAHDLRRTGATILGELGTRAEVIERCLNHTEPDRLRRTYQRQEMKGDRIAAFELLGERLSLLTQPNHSSVVTGRFSTAA